MFRPETMIWVDLLVDRRFTIECLRRLAADRLIELRPYDRDQPLFEVTGDEGLSERLQHVREALDRFKGHLPVADPSALDQASMLLPTRDILPRLEQATTAWLERTGPILRQLEAANTHLERYQVLERCLRALPDEDIDVKYFAAPAHRRLRRYAPVVALGRTGDATLLAETAREALFQAYPMGDDPDASVILGCVDAHALGDLERAAHGRGMRFASIPGELSGAPRVAAGELEQMVRNLARHCATLRGRLDAIGTELNLPGCLWLLRRHSWIQSVMRDALAGRRFVWLGGWIVARRYPQLTGVLEESGMPFLVNCDTDGDHGEPPSELANPRWIRRFEVFARGFGMPSRNEVDPSPLLAAATPLMFGYMFGDVGQGLVLTAVAWLLRRRLPVISLLVPAGLLSAVFGFLFGSVFCSEHLLPALWLRPLADPMTVLIAPVAFGFLFILTGFGLAGLQAHWAGAPRPWWRREFPVVLMYAALPLSLWSRTAALAAGAVGLAIYVAAARDGDGGESRQPGLLRAGGRVIASLLELVENMAQLAINTISFARLGAFALAHAGLGAAVITLAGIPDAGWASALILFLGNALIIALEGLVVSIQTTRLVMFEFFRRFYTASGHAFRPLALPEERQPEPA